MSAIRALERMLAAGMPLEAAIEIAKGFEADMADFAGSLARELTRDDKIDARKAKDAARKREKRASEKSTESADIHGHPQTSAETADASHVRTGAQVVNPSLPSLRSEELVVGGGVVGRERASQTDDWPEGKASDHAEQLIAAVASPWLDPCKSPDLVTTRGRVAAWKRDGASWEHDVLPVVTGLCANRRARISSWKFFDAAVARSIAENRAALEIPDGRVVPFRGTGPPRTIDEKSSASWDYAIARIAQDEQS